LTAVHRTALYQHPGRTGRLDHARYTRAGKLVTTESKVREAKVARPVAARIREAMMPLFINRFYGKQQDGCTTRPFRVGTVGLPGLSDKLETSLLPTG
jgi:hypothetical protein